ncbi:Flotillin-2a [Ataeniobius toweri]|uniref:Flotillin n=1 Tax=Ataeniobius toweri TaxID=208326 RepID=A0ABU7B5B3_9TELE|nr:Flotillin-2a [Ataeniobius toweri]
MGNCHTVGPNEALVVSGGCCGSDQKSYVVGGWAWAWWLISDIQRITLEIMTLQPKCEDVETAEGVAITVTGVAQVKVMTENELLGYACEQFLGKSVIEIKSVILQTLEGHLRAILALAGCLGLLSCRKVNILPSLKSFAASNRFFFQYCPVFSSNHLPMNLPVSAEQKYPHVMTYHHFV